MTEEKRQLPEALQPPSTVTPTLFTQWCAARVGTGNPERMTNPVWVWLARQPTISAYAANRHFAGEGYGRPAGWTNARYGQTVTTLPDGRSLAIAGEHEDSYDPDFWIYNDVIVTSPNGEVEIYGYARDAFPPTDFHSATLVGDHIYIVGNLGYADTRGTHTQVLRMHTGTLAVERLEATGEDPGWLSAHEATLSDDGSRIDVRRGRREIKHGDRHVLRESIDDYALDLATLHWTRLTDRRWQQFEITRRDGRLGSLWDVEQLAYYLKRSADSYFVQQAAQYRERLGRDPDLDAWRTRFNPPVPHEQVPRDPAADDDDNEWRVHRIRVDGTIVRYVDESRGARVVIEGTLATSIVSAIIDDLTAKLSRADAGPYVALSLDGPETSIASDAPPCVVRTVADIRDLPASASEVHVTGVLDDEMAVELNRLPHLRVLQHAGSSSITDAGLRALANLTELEELDLECSTAITDAALDVLATLPRLRYVDLCFCSGLTAAGLARLQQARPALKIDSDYDV